MGPSVSIPRAAVHVRDTTIREQCPEPPCQPDDESLARRAALATTVLGSAKRAARARRPCAVMNVSSSSSQTLPGAHHWHAHRAGRAGCTGVGIATRDLSERSTRQEREEIERRPKARRGADRRTHSRSGGERGDAAFRRYHADAVATVGPPGRVGPLGFVRVGLRRIRRCAGRKRVGVGQGPRAKAIARSAPVFSDHARHRSAVREVRPGHIGSAG
jgi:hypothetical protein